MVTKPAASRPAPASQEPAPLPGEPILVERNGWALFTSEQRRTFKKGLPPPPEVQGDVLTHVGCDSFYHDWIYGSFGPPIEYMKSPFFCHECNAELQIEDLVFFTNLFDFLNPV